MKTIRTILAPVDFSACSIDALEYARDIARDNNATLHIVHVIAPPMFPATLRDYDELEKELETRAEGELSSIAANEAYNAIETTTTVLHGKPWERILEYADEHAIDLISMGTHGHGNIDEFLFGSTTERVLRKSGIPVMATPHNSHEN